MSREDSIGACYDWWKEHMKFGSWAKKFEEES
jgi:hypothetical protein